jgi:hypothetical protein
MSKLYAVDFRKDRHRAVAKRVIRRACDAIEDIEFRPAGFAVIVWDDTGRAAYGFDIGGPVSRGGLANYVSSKLQAAVETIQIKENVT